MSDREQIKSLIMETVDTTKKYVLQVNPSASTIMDKDDKMNYMCEENIDIFKQKVTEGLNFFLLNIAMCMKYSISISDITFKKNIEVLWDLLNLL